MGEVLPVGEQPVMQLDAKHLDAVHAAVVAEPMAGDAGHAAAAGLELLLIEIGPLLHRLVEPVTGRPGVEERGRREPMAFMACGHLHQQSPWCRAVLSAAAGLFSSLPPQ